VAFTMRRTKCGTDRVKKETTPNKTQGRLEARTCFSLFAVFLVVDCAVLCSKGGMSARLVRLGVAMEVSNLS
jgi:hypothetical protein